MIEFNLIISIKVIKSPLLNNNHKNKLKFQTNSNCLTYLI